MRHTGFVLVLELDSGPIYGDINGGGGRSQGVGGKFSSVSFKYEMQSGHEVCSMTWPAFL